MPPESKPQESKPPKLDPIPEKKPVETSKKPIDPELEEKIRRVRARGQRYKTFLSVTYKFL